MSRSMFLSFFLVAIIATVVSAGGADHEFGYGGEVPVVPEFNAPALQYSGYAKSMPSMPNLPQLGLQIEQLPEETMPTQYLEPVIETKFVDQDIVETHHTTQPIIRQMVIEQPIKRHRTINQPLLRKIIHQTVNRPHVHQQNVLKRPVFTQPIVKPSVQVQDTVQQQYAEKDIYQEKNLDASFDSSNSTLYSDAGLKAPEVLEAPQSERLQFPAGQTKK